LFLSDREREGSRVAIATPVDASGSPPTVSSRAAPKTTPWPSLIESALAIAAIAALLPAFERLATNDIGRDGRFAGAAIAIGGLPPRVLPGLCTNYGASAEPLVRDRLCRRSSGSSGGSVPNALPQLVVNAYAEIGRAFQRPLTEAERRRSDLRLQQREGLGDLLLLDGAIEAIDTEIEPYVERYSLGSRETGQPLPVACAFEMVGSSLARTDASALERGEGANANALLLLGAALDGHGATPAAAAAALLPARARSSERGCGTLSLADTLASAAGVMGEARETRLHAAKDEAMRELLRTAGWQWAGWMLAGLVLLKLSRRRAFALTGVGIALFVWAIAAWIGRVPWPLGGDRAFEPARQAGTFVELPAPFVLGLVGVAALALLASIWVQERTSSGPQAIASRIGYPGLVMATGLGWLVLLDLSANGNFSNRYLALYHQGHLWLGMLALTVVAFLRQPVGRALTAMLSIFDTVASGVRRRIGSIAMSLLVVAMMIGVVGLVAAVLNNKQQLTSEVARAWVVVGAAWFFFLRGDPLAKRLATSGTSVVSLLRYVWPLVCIVAVLIGIQLITHYMGPLLIACYGAGAFIAASIAMWWHERSGARYTAFAIAMALFVGWILATTFALFEFGSFDDTTAARLENLAAPLASANDQLALVTWFQRVAPPAGFGIGAVPWCGRASAVGCAGVPAQIQSDYTLTALVGVFGWTAAWAVTIGCAIWLHRLIRHHPRVTHGEPRLVTVAGRMVSDDQALLSWIAVAWVVLSLCQLAVTVAGNLSVLPLTGVTFPFVSFGMTSLVVNMAMLGLAINVNLPSHEPAGPLPGANQPGGAKRGGSSNALDG
jgi:cell division protein FtsW (lipid II flippase)